MVSTIRAWNLPVRPPPKKREDSPSVKLWTRKDFRHAGTGHTNAQRGETDGNATSVRSKGKRGRPCKGSDQGSKTSHFYLENADSTAVSEEQIAEMSRKAHMMWRTLDSDGMAPPTFGQILMGAWDYYSSMMLADEAFEFLLLCDDGEWKLREWSTRSYPSWHRNKFGKDNNPRTEELEQHTENGDKEGDGSDTDIGTSAGNNDDNDHQDVANEDNNTERGPEAPGTQVEPPPAGTLVCEALSIHVAYDPPNHNQGTDAGVPTAPLLVDPL